MPQSICGISAQSAENLITHLTHKFYLCFLKKQEEMQRRVDRDPAAGSGIQRKTSVQVFDSVGEVALRKTGEVSEDWNG